MERRQRGQHVCLLSISIAISRRLNLKFSKDNMSLDPYACSLLRVQISIDHKIHTTGRGLQNAACLMITSPLSFDPPQTHLVLLTMLQPESQNVRCCILCQKKLLHLPGKFVGQKKCYFLCFLAALDFVVLCLCLKENKNPVLLNKGWIVEKVNGPLSFPRQIINAV